MPSKAAFRRGALAAERVLDQHRAANGGAYPETVAVTMWGLDAIKTKGESVAMALALVGATVVSEGTGRVARFEMIPLEEREQEGGGFGDFGGEGGGDYHSGGQSKNNA